MYEINFHTKFSSTWFAAFSIVSSSFHFLSSIWEYERKFHTKGFSTEKYENFRPRKVLLLQYHGIMHTGTIHQKAPVKKFTPKKKNPPVLLEKTANLQHIDIVVP